jgi:hypothetical protein
MIAVMSRREFPAGATKNRAFSSETQSREGRKKPDINPAFKILR